MGFYDLNVPAAEEDGNGKQAKNTLKLVIKLMGLGYSGIAYNKFLRLGDNCVDNSGELIFAKPPKPLPVSSFLVASPLLQADVRFHREVLGVSLKQPFRQYSRATVEIQNMVQMSAFKKFRPELKDYDLVAVCPLDYAVFENACQKADVDIICINFGANLPFLMKKSLVKTAIERGLFFEIMYSPMVASKVARRETLANVRALVDWSGGRNLIISSGANSVKDLRGPYDVANMSTLFGISMERAKAAVSKNCKDVILRGLERKRLRITVKRAPPPSGALGSHQAKIKVSDIWDPMSSGDGDVDLTALLKDNLNLFMGSLDEETQQHCPSKIMPSNNSVNYKISQPAQVLAPRDCRNIQTSGGDAGKEAFTSVFSSDVLDGVRYAVESKENDVEATCENLDLSFLNPIHRAVGCSPKTQFQKSTETVAGINTMDYSNITKPRGSLKEKGRSAPFAGISEEDTLRPDEGGKHSMRFGIKSAQQHSQKQRLKDALRPLGGVVKSTTSKKRRRSNKGKRLKQGGK